MQQLYEYRYYFEQQFKPLADETKRIAKYGRSGQKQYDDNSMKTGRSYLQDMPITISEQGRNARCVWSIAVGQLREEHYAAFPVELPERCIKAGCPRYICDTCGKPMMPVIDKEYKPISGKRNVTKSYRNYGTARRLAIIRNVNITSCDCNNSFSPGIVLDPFMGAGTTGVVAIKQDKKFIGIELNEKYIKDIAIPRLRTTALSNV